MRIALAALVALAVAVTAASCGEKEEPAPVAPTTEAAGGGGGGGAPEKGSEEKQDQGGSEKKEPPIPLAVENALSGGSPGACTEVMTQRYVRTAYGDLAGCEAAIKRLPDFGVAVSDVKVSGGTATAKAEPDGGPNKGETIRVELLRDGDAWKVDSAISNAPPGP